MKTRTGSRRLSPTAVATLFGAVSLSLAEMTGAEERSSDGLWQEIAASSMAVDAEREIMPRAYRMMRLNKDVLGRVLRDAPMEFTEAARGEGVVMTLPMPNGKAGRFRIEESPIMSPELAAKFPEIKTYRGQGIDDPTATVRFDVTPLGFHAQVLSGQETFYVDPYAKGDTQNYISYFKSDFRKTVSPRCLAETPETGGEETVVERHPTAPLVVPPNGATLRTYRLALAATAEYTIAAGGTVPLAMARMTTSMNRVNGIYERELALRMTLVAGNDALIYTDPNTDPYTNNDIAAMMTENQNNLDSVIGTANYDIGHVLATSDGGSARIRSTCNATFKGGGATGLPNPVGDHFDVAFLTHEMGHQHGGLHTFNTTTGICAPPFRNALSTYEPGSGSTPMSYVGTCAPNNLQPTADDYFHVRSLEQMVAHMTVAGNCAAQTATGNTPPTISAGGNFTIPRNTPFTLTASASDANADAVTYAWEEYDLAGMAGASPPEGDADGVPRPIFRTYPPTINPTRTFPSLPYILNNANVPPATYDCGMPEPCIIGESLPNITRTMNFQVTARDNRAGGGGIVSAMMQVNVDAGAGPFVVTQPDTAVSWAGGTQKTVLWNVANTNAAPVNAANVNIRLSTDGGNTFPFFLAVNTPNDGTEAITVPNFSTTMARIKVEAAANIFFDISGANFSISGSGPFPLPTTLANLATRLRVETGDNVLIGGFIVTGTQLKKVIVRGIGPSLTLANKLANPTLELRNSAGGLIEANDDWMQSPNKQAIIDSTIPPKNDLESAIVAMLPANNGYTAIVRGASNTTGIGVVEVYDLDRAVDSKLANISTRGLVQTGDTILIAGTIVLGETAQKVIVRAIGPSLPIAGKLLDPTLELRDANGGLIRGNDNWRIGGQEADIIATTIPPSHDSESAIVATLPANGASYTAIVRGAGNTTGIAVVEVYALN